MTSDIEKLYNEMMDAAEDDTERVCTALIFEFGLKVSELMTLKSESFEKDGDDLFITIPNIGSLEYQTSVELAYRKMKLESSKDMVEKILGQTNPTFFSKNVIDRLKTKGFSTDDVMSMKITELKEKGFTQKQLYEFMGTKIT